MSLEYGKFLAKAMISLLFCGLAFGQNNNPRDERRPSRDIHHDITFMPRLGRPHSPSEGTGWQTFQSVRDSNTTLIGRWANGPCYAVDVSGNIACFGNGGYLEVVDISDPANPIELGKVLTPSVVLDVAVSGSYAYVADWKDGLRIIDISTPAAPVEAGFYNTGGSAWGVAVSGSYAYVADVEDGLRIIDISTPAAPVEVGFYDTGSFAYGVAVSDSYAYVADFEDGLRIIDISTPAAPVEAGFYNTGGSAWGVAVSGSYAYVADFENGLLIIDISTPAAPVEAGFHDTGGDTYHVAVSGSYAYIADGLDGLRIIDVSTPAAPVEAGFHDTGGAALNVAVSGSYAYVAGGENGLRIIDVSIPATPVEAGFHETGGAALGVAASGSYAYVADGLDGLRIIDISTPAAPAEAGFYNTGGYAEDVAISGSYAYVADFEDGLRIIDVSTPVSPVEVGFYDTGGFAWSVAVSGSYAYVADFEDGLRIIDISTPAAPAEAGFYDTGSYAYGVAVSGSYAYVADGNDGLRIIDVSTPAVPVETGFYDTGGYAEDVTVSGNYAYVADYRDGLRIIDVSTPAAPVEVGFYDTGSYAYDVAVSGNYAYVADYRDGLRIIDVSIADVPVEVGFYETGGHAYGVAVRGSYAYVADREGGMYIIQNDLLAGIDPFIFTGHVYQGNPPDISIPVGGITVRLYGDDDEWPESGLKTELASTTTNGSGEFTLNSGSGNSNYNYYHVMETDPAGAISVGAQAGHPGYVKNFNCISYENATLTPGNTYSGSAFWDIQSTTGNTPTGFDVSVTLSDDVSITFDEVTAAGNTTLETSHTGPQPPNNFVVHPPSAPTFYDINTTAGYSGLIHLNIHYDDTEIDTEMENDLILVRYIESHSEWLGITTAVDINNNLIHGLTDQLSVFAIMYQIGGPGETGLIVTNCDDSGAGSLRDAILYANDNPGPDTIRFQIPRGVPGYDTAIGVWTIAPQSPLPSITDGLLIDGFSQKEYSGEDTNPDGPEIYLNGTLAGQDADGLRIISSGVYVLGLTIGHFQESGILIDGGTSVGHVDGGRIAGCYVGVSPRGDSPAANGFGILLRDNIRNVTISPADTFKNVVSGNTYSGIIVRDTSSHVIIQGNIIGLNRTGMYTIGNGDNFGISFQGQCDSVDVYDNWIGGNKYGIFVLSSHNITIGNNFIGMNKIDNEILELGNESNGIYLAEGAHDNLITHNFIRFNGACGVYINGANTIRNKVSNNHISGNGFGGICNESGGNLELAPPVISSASATSVTGTAIPNATVEIYTDPEYQGLIFQGETNSDASGNFTWNGTITGQFTNVTAIAIDDSDNTSAFSQVAVITNVEKLEDSNIPETFSLSQNYPNPFNPQTTIQFEIPFAGKQTVKVELHIYNLQGQLIRTLINEKRSPGAYQMRWDGLDEAGNNVQTGIYLYCIRAGEFDATKKMILMK